MNSLFDILHNQSGHIAHSEWIDKESYHTHMNGPLCYVWISNTTHTNKKQIFSICGPSCAIIWRGKNLPNRCKNSHICDSKKKKPSILFPYSSAPLPSSSTMNPDSESFFFGAGVTVNKQYSILSLGTHTHVTYSRINPEINVSFLFWQDQSI